ncbi:hypothetical protein TNCV_4069591 [Trichonephila clavipes]|nr:hypothetical protein TNCV_4069591 [Trichonephila clavipes]
MSPPDFFLFPKIKNTLKGHRFQDIETIKQNSTQQLQTIAKSTRGLLVTDHVILNHGQVTWTTPEQPPSPNYHFTPTGGHFSSQQI